MIKLSIGLAIITVFTVAGSYIRFMEELVS